MKKWYLRAASALLAALLLASPALATEVLQTSTTRLADSAVLTSSFLGGAQTQKEHLLTYTPGGDVTPMVVYGDSLYGRSTMNYIEDYLSRRGLTAVGAINASFFDMANGLPIGMVVTDGVLRINGFDTAVGIFPDGAVRIGSPTVSVTGVWGSHEVLLHYNQLLTANNGMVLYSRDYDTKTKGKIPGYHVVLEADSTALTLGGQVTARVTKLVEDTKSCAIPKDGFVLSLVEDGGYEPFQEAIRALRVGDAVELTVQIDSGWQDAAYIVGGGDMLVENGRAKTGFTLDSAGRPAARTALGIRADGSVVCYTVDKSAISGGMTLSELARRMEELGCVTAVNLDGGGSTCMGVTQPGQTAFTTVNEPSDGEQRACANYIFFTRPTTAAGAAEHLYVYPYDQAVLAGGQLQLTALAADGNYMPAALPGGLSWSASSGSIVDGLLTAGGEGTTTVTAYSGPLSGTVTVHVVKTPTELVVLRQDTQKELETILIECGTALELTAQASYLGLELPARDRNFTWTLSGNIGRIDAEGLYQAGGTEAAGVLRVQCGEKTVELPVQTRVNPMVDLDGHWAREPISQLYFREILKGEKNGAGEMIYRPDDSMTRQEFVVAMVRWLGLDPADYAEVELPFADAASIADWALGSVKAAYQLGYFTGSSSGKKTYADPTDTITREAAMTLLARTIHASSSSDALEEFPDEKKVSDWAREALTAMVEQGIINGIDGKLSPQGKVTRAQVAKMLYAMTE